eukprot:9504175-Pyramimonas_sp.AAC.3
MPGCRGRELKAGQQPGGPLQIDPELRGRPRSGTPKLTRRPLSPPPLFNPAALRCPLRGRATPILRRVFGQGPQGSSPGGPP